MKKFGFILVSLMLMACSTAYAAQTWNGSIDNNWGTAGNWSGGIVPGGMPGNAQEADIYTTATVNINCDVNDNSSVKLTNNASQTVVLNLNDNYTVRIQKDQQQMLYVGQTGTATVNQSAGTMRVGTISGTNFAQGEIRIGSGAAGYYNLSGGLLDADIVRKNAKTSVGGLSITGGTIAIRNTIYNMTTSAGDWFQLVADGATQDVTFAPGGVDRISTWSRGSGAANVEIGYSGGSTASSENFDADNGTLEFDIASITSYDKVQVFGDVTLNDCDIVVNAIAGYTAVAGDYFDAIIIAYGTEAAGYDYRATKGISGEDITVLTQGWVASLVNADGTPGNDILRLTYVPEPATIALIGLGLIAIRRKK